MYMLSQYGQTHLAINAPRHRLETRTKKVHIRWHKGRHTVYKCISHVVATFLQKVKETLEGILIIIVKMNIKNMFSLN
jgi:hypothetical protein